MNLKNIVDGWQIKSKVPFHVFGNYFEFNAIVVPHIDLKVTVDNLNLIVNSLKSKGYKLADKCLVSGGLISNFG